MNANRGDMSEYAESYALEDIFMKQARTNGAELGLTDPTPAVGLHIKFLIKMSGAKSIVEIGTGSGVSGLWIFQGLASDGVLTSIDVEREHSRIARTIFDDAGIASHRFRLITGKVIDVVGKLADSSYDMIVIHPAFDLFDVTQEAYRLLKPKGMMVIDQVMSGGRVADPTQRDGESISRRETIKAVKEDSRWNSSLLPLGDGVLVATKNTM